MSNALTVEKIGSTAVVSFERGERRNAMSLKIMQELTRLAESFKDRADISCVILAGTSTEFSAGVDLKDGDRWNVDALSLDELRVVASWGPRMCKAWEDMPQLTIAAVEGLNIGGGVALAVSCDWRVLAKSGYFKVPEAQIGLPMGWQTIPRLTNLVGPSRAKQIILFGDRIDSETALDWGLVDWVVDDGSAKREALALAERVGRTTGVIVKMTKQSVNAHSNALSHLSSYMDIDQLLMYSQGGEAKAVRQRFGSSQPDGDLRAGHA
ncbi:MAG: enoyl-CoA hydratase/isomerase family protein [Burkholderiaceae bacterium]